MKITLLNKSGINVTISLERLVETIINLKKKEIVDIAMEILDDDDEMKEFVNRRYKSCLKNTKEFNEMSNNPVFGSAAEKYGKVSEDYAEEAELWKHFVDFYNKPKR